MTKPSSEAETTEALLRGQPAPEPRQRITVEWVISGAPVQQLSASQGVGG